MFLMFSIIQPGNQLPCASPKEYSGSKRMSKNVAEKCGVLTLKPLLLDNGIKLCGGEKKRRAACARVTQRSHESPEHSLTALPGAAKASPSTLREQLSGENDSRSP